MTTGRPLSVAVACAGLGHVDRGYERFSRDLAAVLRADPSLEVTVERGGGPDAAGEHVLPALRRGGRPARAICRVLGWRAERGPHAGDRSQRGRGRLVRDAFTLRLPVAPYEVEQATFGLALVLRLLRHPVDVVVVHDVLVAKLLHAARRVLGRGPAILFVNGAPWPAPYAFADVVQHLTPPSRDLAVAAGDPPDRNVVLPCGVRMFGPPPTPADRHAARARLGLPAEAWILLSVGALNRHHKRHHHLVDEVASLGDDRPYVVIAGAHDPEEAALRRVVADALGARAEVRTVGPDQMGDLYRAADGFALASVVEGFGLAYVEAASVGLPVIAHDTPTTRWVLGPSATLVDMQHPGALAAAVQAAMAPHGDDDASARAEDVRARFAWDSLAPRYVELVRQAAVSRQAS